MFHVYNVAVVREDKEWEKYNLEKLIRFHENCTEVEAFKPWFDCSSSIVWKPQLLPPVLYKDKKTTPNEREISTTNKNTNHTSIKHQPSSILEKTEKNIPSISPLLREYLKNDAQKYNTKHSLTKIKWHSSLTIARKMSKNENKLCEKDPSMVEKLKERASCFGSSNCRGKWVILASSMINDFTLEDLWSKLSDELYQDFFEYCNLTFQTDPDRILIYTNFLSSTMVPKVFSSIGEMVGKMSYIVHPCGKVLSWNGGEFVII